jgi:BCCT family betaine/carnitine transporter
LASSATLNIPAGDDPSRGHRVFWAFALGLLPITLMYIGNYTGFDILKVMQVVLLVVSLPILVVGIVMCVSLVKSLKEDS